MLNESLYSSDKIEWETPQPLFDKIHREFNFELDSCASENNAKCVSYFSVETDTLKQNWYGKVWMNPPYGRQISNFVCKAYEEVAQNHAELVVCLLPVRSDTRWWHRYCMKASEIRLLTRRLEFVGSDNKAPFPACLVIFREVPNQPILLSYEV